MGTTVSVHRSGVTACYSKSRHFALLWMTLLIGLVVVTHAEEYYYKKPVNGLWSDLRNWVTGSQDSDVIPNSLPTTGDSVYITVPGQYEVSYDVGIDQTPVFEKLVIGSGDASLPMINPSSSSGYASGLELSEQMLTLKNPLSVNSLIEIRSSGRIVLEAPLVSVKGGAKLVCAEGGVLIQKDGLLELIGDVEISGIYVLEGGTISGSADRPILIKKPGTFRTFGNAIESVVHRVLKVEGTYDHSSNYLVQFSKELYIDPDGSLLINANGPLFTNVGTMKGSMIVNSESNIRGTFNISGKLKILKPLNIIDSLTIQKDGLVHLDYASLTCQKSCKLYGTLEGSSQTQSNFVTLSKLGILEVYPDSYVKGNLVILIERGSRLISMSEYVNFSGRVEGEGDLVLVSGKFRCSSITLLGQLMSDSKENIESSKNIDINGEVRIFGSFIHNHTSSLIFNSGITIERDAKMIWLGSGDIMGDGFLNNRGLVRIYTSASLGLDRVRNEGIFYISSTKFAIVSNEFVQNTDNTQLQLNGTRLVLESMVQLKKGFLIVADPEESYLVVSKSGSLESLIPIAGKLSLALYGKMNQFNNLTISRNIDVFPDASLTVTRGNMNGYGQLLIHKDGMVVITTAATSYIEKVLMVAGTLEIHGTLFINNDITTLEGTGKIRLVEGGSISGTGQLSNHGEFYIDTSTPSVIGIPINNAGMIRIKSNTKFLKPVQQVDSKAKTLILRSSISNNEQEFSFADGFLLGMGTIHANKVNIAGEYGAFIDDEVGKLKIEGSLHSSASAVAHFKILAEDEYSIIDVSDDINIDGSVLEVDVKGRFNLDGRSIALFRGKKINGEFGEVRVSGTNAETEVKYMRDGKILLKFKDDDNSSAQSLSLSYFTLFSLLITTLTFVIFA